MGRPEQLARRVTLASIATSAVLAVIKIAVGLEAGSVAVVSDGLESAADVFASSLEAKTSAADSRPSETTATEPASRPTAILITARTALVAMLASVTRLASCSGRPMLRAYNVPCARPGG